MHYLYITIIGSLIFIYELLFTLIYRSFVNPAVSVIVLSIVINFIVLPLYNKADMLQKEEQNKKLLMEPRIKQIRGAFKKDEQFMMLSAYYRECNYNPLNFLKEAVPLLLQIPFFIAAYQFISSLAVLDGASFGPINNLIEPDRLIVIGAFSVNLLPLLMTAINLVAGAIYSKGSTTKLKVQIAITALIFLVLLYDSPSGLVLYWTMNNVFSLAKNAVQRLSENKRKIVRVLIAFVVLGMTETLCIMLRMQTEPAEILVIGSISYIVLTLGHNRITDYIYKHFPFVKKWRKPSNVHLFSASVLSVIGLTALLGFYIPSTVLSSSVYEFLDYSTGRFNYDLLLYPLSIYSGILLIWCTVFFFSLSDKGRVCYMVFASASLLFSVLNQFVFHRSFGTLYSNLRFDQIIRFPLSLTIVNGVVGVIIILLCIIVLVKKPVLLNYASIIVIVSLVALSGRNLYLINNEYEAMEIETGSEIIYDGILHLSRTENNVVVFMLDRAMGAFVPYIFDEKPELLDSFRGFVYYPNTVSFGRCTNIGAPSIFGGYEYTPAEINSRTEESLADKYDQALLLMPVLFSQEGFDVTVTDPPYAGYATPSDLSIYDEYSGIRAYSLDGKFTDDFLTELGNNDPYTRQRRNFVMYSAYCTAPIALRSFIYDKGNYIYNNLSSYYSDALINCYSTLTRLNLLTSVDDFEQGGFLLLQNETPHNPAYLAPPNYAIGSNDIQSVYVDESNYYWNRVADGQTLEISDNPQLEHYCINVATYQQLAIWLDYLREQGVYDNTRIILVSDHGYPLGQFSDLLIPDGIDVEGYMPLLMVKDFNSNGPLTTDYTFMTNADVPTLAMEGIIGNPVNPFTGNPISSDAKSEDVLYVTSSYNWGLDANDGYRFDLSDGSWWAVRENLYDLNNWVRVSEEEVFS